MKRTSRILLLSGLFCAVALTTACQAPVNDKNPIETPIKEPERVMNTLQNAAIYQCGDAGELKVAFDSDPTGVRAQLGDAEMVMLTPGELAETQSFSNDTMTLSVSFDRTTLTLDGATHDCEAVSRALPPPTIANIVKDLRTTDQQSPLTLQVGETFSVSLVGVPTAGYQWTHTSLPDFLTVIDQTGGATNSAQFLPGFAGGNHWEVLVFRAEKAGSGKLLLEQRRPWEDASEPPADTATFEITVK